MDVDDDVPVVRSKSRKTKVNMDFGSDDEEDNVVKEYDVVVCTSLPNTEMYRIQFPMGKKRVFSSEKQPRVRYKKNVRMLEMRLDADTQSGSYDKTKADRFAVTALGNSNVKKEEPLSQNAKTDEIYEGRAYGNENPLQYAIGFVREGTFYINPIEGNFDMHRSISHINVRQKNKDDEGDMSIDSDTDAPGGSGQQVRVKFARPETERQKKRREESALHREKMIASDAWIAMNVHMEEDSAVLDKWEKMIPRCSEGQISEIKPKLRELVHKAIICEKREQLDLSRGDQNISYQRITELPCPLQVKAQVIKARVISTNDVARLVDSSISRQDLIYNLQQCAHLVQGVWVLQSDFLFQNLPPAYSNIPGKVDEHRSEIWRFARDLALCLVDAGLRVTRGTLSRCFRLSSRDAEEILSSFAIQSNRTWRLRIEPDMEFIQNPDNLAVVLQERRYWMERWNEVQRKIDYSTNLERTKENNGL